MLAAGVLAGILWVFHCAPLLYICLVAEDHFGEYATAASLLLSAALLATAAFRRGPRLRRWWLACACLAALLIAGEELSWGQRLLGFRTPDAFSGVNTQEEFNVHNLSRLEDMKLHAAAGYAVLAWVGFSVAIALAGPAVRDRLDRTGFPLLPMRLVAPVSLFPFFCHFSPFSHIDNAEVWELALGIAMLCWAADQVPWREVRLWPRPLPSSVAAVALLALAACAALALARLRPGNPAAAINLAAAHDYPDAGLYAQAETLYRHIYAHPELVRKDTRRNHRNMLLRAERAQRDESPAAGGGTSF